MLNALSVARWEWFKLRRGWLPWIVLAALALTFNLSWFEFFAYRSYYESGGNVPYGSADKHGYYQTVNCNDLRTHRFPDDLIPEPNLLSSLLAQCDAEQPRFEEQLRERYDDITLPNVLAVNVGTYHLILVFFLIILTASVIGGEYATGTLRPAIGIGVGRGQFLLGKLLMVAIAFSVMGAFVATVIILGALISESLLSGSYVPRGESTATWSQAAGVLARGWFAGLPYIGLVGMAAVALRSNAYAIIAALGFVIVETILESSVFDRMDGFKDFDQLFLGRAVAYFTDGGLVTPPADFVRPSDLELGLVIAVWAMATSAIGLLIFQRRDIRGAEGS